MIVIQALYQWYKFFFEKIYLLTEILLFHSESPFTRQTSFLILCFQFQEVGFYDSSENLNFPEALPNATQVDRKTHQGIDGILRNNEGQ